MLNNGTILTFGEILGHEREANEMRKSEVKDLEDGKVCWGIHTMVRKVNMLGEKTRIWWEERSDRFGGMKRLKKFERIIEFCLSRGCT